MLATTGCAAVLSLGNDGGTEGGRLLELCEQGNLSEISIGPGWYPRNGYFVALRYAGYLDRTGCHRYHSCRRILQRGMDDRVLAIATSWRDQSRNHPETHQGEIVSLSLKIAKRKNRAPSGTRLCQIRMALRYQNTCETYGLRYARPDPERRADAICRLASRSTGTSLPGGYR